MPSRVIREGLLESPKYWAAGTEAQRLYHDLFLVTCDFACFNAARLVIGRKCFQQPPSQAKLDGLYKKLADVDLVRFYFAGDEKWPEMFGFIPKFRQSMRLMKAKHPMPPASLFEDDPDAVKKFSQYKHLFLEMPSTRTTRALQVQCTRIADLDSESTLISSRKDLGGRDLDLDLPVPPVPDARATPDSKKDESHQVKGNGNDQGNDVRQGHIDLEAWAVTAGLVRRADESAEQFRARASMAYVIAQSRIATTRQS